MKTGKIVQVMGPVVDVEFEDNDLPFIKDALEVDNGGKRCVMEVAQHIGNNTVRCIMLAASEGHGSCCYGKRHYGSGRTGHIGASVQCIRRYLRRRQDFRGRETLVYP